MPLDEEGAKWSCEPCIRGHRSSKCQHFDRLMMKVPKAGRPLAKCPHPKGSCSCERVYAFMVRIPKGSSCLCRPIYQVPASSAETPSQPSHPATPSMPSTPAAAGRIQKPSRRPSMFQSPSDNIIRALDSELLQSDFNRDVTLPGQFTGSDTSTNHKMAPGNITNPITMKYKSQGSPRKPVLESQPGTCCAPKSAPVAAAQKRSCCDPAPEETKNEDIAVPQACSKSELTEFNNSNHSSWSTNLPNNNYVLGHSYTSINSQSPAYRKQSQATQPVPRSFSTVYQENYEAPSTDQFFHDSSTYPFNISYPLVNDNSHDCSCGDGCQCLGCASHPFNETTRQHVQEMGYMMTVKEDEEKSHNPGPFRSTPALSSQGLPDHKQPIMPNTGQSFAEDTGLTTSFDNTLTSSNFHSDQFMQPSEYYTLEYPVGFDICSNTKGTCQCGNDCSCVGCLTHSGHDGIVLESMPTESQQRPNDAVILQDLQGYLTQSTDMPRSMDQYSPSALSPPVIETQLV